MTKKARFIIVLMLVVIFLVIAPYIVLYSLGYRIDFSNQKITATGGIYVHALPTGTSVSIDQGAPITASLLSNAVFVQNLVPQNHQVTITKDGYHNYQKNVQVKENQVTKLEHVVLIKNSIAFSALSQTADYISMPTDKSVLLTATFNEKTTTFNIVNPDTLETQKLSWAIGAQTISKVTWADDAKKALLSTANHYALLDLSKPVAQIISADFLASAQNISFNPQNNAEIFFIKNKNLYSNLLALPLVKNVIAYKKASETVYYLSGDGLVYAYNINTKTATALTSEALALPKNGSSEILEMANMLFIKQNDSLLILNNETHNLEAFYQPATDAILSADGQKILYVAPRQIAYSLANSISGPKTVISTFAQDISNVAWLNDDYIIFTTGGAIAISEIDPIGGLNIVYLPRIVPVGSKNIEIKDPVMYLDPKNKKAYLLTGGDVIISERLVP